MNDKAPSIGKGNPSYFGLKLSGNYYLPSLEKAYMATGHNSALISSSGKRYICNHTRFDDGTEYHEPRVHQYFLNEEKWPCMLPYATSDETIEESGYDSTKIVGEYYMINQGTTIDADIAEPVKVVLTEDGLVVGKDADGTWSVTEGSPYVHISYDGKDYSGVFCEMKDEADTPVFVFSAVGSNESIWGVKYE
jgi:arabinan endo-1,5-alpha-L-arabinosidase